jgi:hypothetical protein
VNLTLADIERIVADSGAGEAIEALLPPAARGRQLKAGALLTGKMLALADGRPAHLTRAHQALISLSEHEQKRLGVIEDWKTGPHQLTYRQVEHTNRLITRALAKTEPDGAPSAGLQHVCDQLLEASIPGALKNASTSLAVDWTDVEAWARPVPHEAAGTGTDPEASWGHRNVNRKIQEGEMFFGYYMSAAVMVADENGPAVPELARRITAGNSSHDPAAALAGVLTSMPAGGIALGDIIADSGYSHRVPDTWANPLRAAGASLVHDLHPNDRGPRGTHHGAIIANGCLYCPKTPPALLELTPLPPGASTADVAAHDQQTAELARHKLGIHAGEDADGYRRHACPAVTGKVRCPLRPASTALDRSRPEILTPPEHPPACCTQNPAETRLPLTGVADLLPPAHRRRTAQRRHQRHRRQQHRPRLDPPDGRHPAHALARLPHGRAQPAHLDRLPDPARTRRARHRPAAHPQTPPPARRHRSHAALTRPANPASPQQPPLPAPPARAQPRPQPASADPGTRKQPGNPAPAPRTPGKQDQLSATARMSEAYVSIKLGAM